MERISKVVLVTQLIFTTNILADGIKCKRGTYKNEDTYDGLDRKNSIGAARFIKNKLSLCVEHNIENTRS